MPSSELESVLRGHGEYERALREYPDVFGCYARLRPAQQHVACQLLEQYLRNRQRQRVHKLLKHAVRYAADGKLTAGGPNLWIAAGDHGERHVHLDPDRCTCPMFYGEPPFDPGDEGDCSHIMAAKILRGVPHD